MPKKNYKISKSTREILNRKDFSEGPIPPETKNKYCKVKNCKKLKRARGFCDTHYKRWQLYGDPNFGYYIHYDVIPTCIINGCNNPIVNKREWCDKHYHQFLTTGDPEKYTRIMNVKEFKCKIEGCNKQATCKYMCKNHYTSENRKKNPQLNNNKDSLELNIAKQRVRIRDNNTCQWYGCDLNSITTIINVHHIFPRNEYPELELIEEYMICYCIDHHAYWHKARGDKYYKFIESYKSNIIQHKCESCKKLIGLCTCIKLDKY